jgi:hypothetical protein
MPKAVEGKLRVKRMDAERKFKENVLKSSVEHKKAIGSLKWSYYTKRRAQTVL